ncbi:hypothetical protein KFL_001070280 [Klebsormidium nitens]|uniref:Uncharacterized protein n=1 Tax=Klebsormidium nitens TaxID=105231 RepID=A0A1Y1HX14_KLENI|nr:hypothetical protein KFL_001070280 [Klebsormidium nitens]|eukprot:GAQ82322.1 hypothetical protein KFL_001070280 [Klebsormidium nitens]
MASGGAVQEKMQHMKEGAKETMKKATHPFDTHKKAEDHGQAEAAKAQATNAREERNMQRAEGQHQPNQERSFGTGGSNPPTVAGENTNTSQGDPSARDPATSPEIEAETYQPSSLDQPSGGVKGAVKKAVNKLTPGDGIAGPNAAMTEGSGPSSAMGSNGNVA